ncbi:MAG: hypothetical protein ACRBB6_08095 [Neptuniibacter sp.]
MEVPTEALELSIFLFKHIEDKEIDGRTVSGRLPECFDFSEVLRTLDRANLLGMDDEPSRVIEYTLPHRMDGFFAFDLDELLENPTRRYEAPTRFYLSDLDFLFSPDVSETNTPIEVKNYLDIVELISSFQSVANYSYPLNGSLRLVFLEQRKLEFDVSYTATDLVCLPDLNDFQDQFVESSIHAEQKGTILRASLMELFQGTEGQDVVPIKELFTRFSDLHRRITHGYELYVSEFSFEKIKGQVEKEKVEFVARLNKVFSDIQNQLLAVPAALILAGGQMDNTGEWKESNILIWLGCIVFAMFMTMLIRNQRVTLEAVKTEMSHQWEQIENEHRSVAPRFQEIYQFLNKRYLHQKWLLRFIDFIVAVVIAATTIMLLWYSATEDDINKFITVVTYLATPFLCLHLLCEYRDDIRPLLKRDQH